jgi:methionyl-tRNA formyltransferase
MNIIFFGTSEFSLHALDRLLELGVKIKSVVTVPDKPQGRKMLMTPPPAKVWAERHEIPFLQFEKLDEAAVAALAALKPDLFIVASYGKIIPKHILDIPVQGTINIHPSILPKYRGATPLQSAILADDKNMGVTLMLMDEKMDHGPILSVKKIELGTWPPKFTELEYVSARAGADMAAEYIAHPEAFTPREQDHAAATFTKKIEKEDGLVSILPADLKDEKGWTSYLKYMALEGWPGLFFYTERRTPNAEPTKIRVSVKLAQWNA